MYLEDKNAVVIVQIRIVANLYNFRVRHSKLQSRNVNERIRSEVETVYCFRYECLWSTYAKTAHINRQQKFETMKIN